MMKSIALVTLLLTITILSAIHLKAQPNIAVIIPDLCTPGLNTALEIMSPANQKGSFGNDGFYLNNPGDEIRVKTLRDADSNKIIFSPFIISWEGRLISVQAFVNPVIAGGPNPNSWDWSLLTNDFRIPICVTVNGVQSSIDTLYIVQPFPFGDRSGDSQTSILGAGTWGKRSRSGAMIVDSMTLPSNGKFEVNKLDCDPYRNGNQGYLPFTLIVKGNVKGKNSIISVNADKQNGGPGGGGGAGGFTDFITTPGRSGDGYTGGAPSGQNLGVFGKNSLSIGTGTGNSGSGKTSGSSITNVRGGEFKEYEGGGGGTGHPFGMSGSGWDNKIEINGFYGGGSSPKDLTAGGGGGYRTPGASSDGVNGGKIHGNRASVPIAGGSGGAAGNPRGGRSGYGGGGGGAISLQSNSIEQLTIEARGATGENESPFGGGGSGGYVGLGARNSLRDIIEVTSGGLGNTYGGEGRFRFDSPIYPQGNPKGFPIINVDGQDSYRGLSLEYASTVDRSKSLSMVYSSGDSIQFYLKANNGNWIPYIFGPAADNVPLIMPFNDPNLLPDSLYYLMAIQSNRTFKTINEYQHEPIAIISQSAGNILYAPTFPIIASDTIVQWKDNLICKEDTIKQSLYLKNTGSGMLRIDSLRMKNSKQGFSYQFTNLPANVKPGDSVLITITFTNAPRLGILQDTLIAYSNARNDSTWSITLSGVKEQLSFAYRNINALNYSRSFMISNACIGSSIQDTIYIINGSSVAIPSDSIRVQGSNDISIIPVRNIIPARDSALFIIRFTPSNKVKQLASILFHHPLCDTTDVISIEGTGIQTILTANPAFVSKPNQSIGTTTIDSVLIRNTGDASAFIDVGSFGLQYPFQIIKTIPSLPILLKSGDSLQFIVSISMDSVGTNTDTIEVQSIAQGMACEASVAIPITATATLPTLELRFNNSAKANPKEDSYDIPIVYSIPGVDSVLADMSVSFSINGSVFYPKSASKGNLSSTLDANGRRIINVSFNKELLSSKDSLLTIVKGFIQLDTFPSSTIQWQPAKWNSIPYALIKSVDGNLELDLCEEGDGKRLIINGQSPVFLKVFPNPIDNSSQIMIDFPIHRIGMYECTIRNIHGKELHSSIMEFNDLQSIGMQHSLKIDASSLTAGTYFISLIFEGSVLTERLLVLP
ncbi:MAG: hypothetical protein ACO30P_07970 [Candidatus Kapaibacteriota bacterium]